MNVLCGRIKATARLLSVNVGVPRDITWCAPVARFRGERARDRSTDRWFADSLLEEAGFELFVPQGISASPS